uniref:Uncharacterized protein n=1 Tax=Alexandrium catenella TaxID=2925 RepID=A0A7S1QXE8_ALECA
MPATPTAAASGHAEPSRSGGRTRSAASGADPSMPPSSHRALPSREGAARSAASTADRSLPRAQSSPEIDTLDAFSHSQPLQVSMRTRQIQYKRTPMGGFFADAVPWQVTIGNSPVLPSRHHSLSRTMSSNFQPVYMDFERVSESKAALINHSVVSPKTYNRARDGLTRYNEERFKLGNQQIMRKGGGMMPTKKA